ncbi:MAG: zf-TFIIB domain-containing protein [Gemmatimonadota bacterium]|nr:zf-TFIIB domain-containing protein [Gemmatimonadota bacterium]MDH5283272.1 zf-TFIIB domain-containing protein [Gemmatimonadota bacterium]
MTTEFKPSRNEDEYFLKLDAERIERKRQQEEARASDAERRSHFMRCPKCGGHLETHTLQQIEVDTCPDCKGSWFDFGEVRAILAHYDKGLVFRLMDDVMVAFGKKPSPKVDL